MAQAHQQTRSISDKSTFRVITEILFVPIIILALIIICSSPRADGTTTSHSASEHKTTAVVHKQAQTLPSLDLIQELLRTHPHPDVRGEFYEMVRDGKMKTFWTQGASAAFGLIPANTSRRSEMTQTAGLSPVLLVNPKILPPANRASTQLSLYHEFVHYEQWRDGRMPIETFIPKKIGFGEEAREACTKKWHAEVEAYHQECAYARKSNLLTQIDTRSELFHLCDSSQEAFEETLRVTLVRNETLGAACATTWASL